MTDANDVSPDGSWDLGERRLRLSGAPEAAAWCRLLERLEPTLAHDLRGPLNALTLHLELLRRVSEGLEPAPAADRVRRSVESLDRELGRITTHIDALLRLIGAPQEPPLHASLAALLQECQRDVGTAARHRGVELRVALDSDVPLHQHEVLRRALLLVLLDALEGAAPGSAVQLEVGRENGRVVAALAWRPSGAQRDSEQAELDLAPVRALLHRCGGELDEQGDAGAPVLRLRFPVEVES